MSSLRPSTSLAALAARGPRHTPVLAALFQRRFLPTSSSSSLHTGSSSNAGGSSSSSGAGYREPPKTNKHKQWYRELVPAALPAIAIGMTVYMALQLLRLTLSSERELLALNAQVATLEAELADLQDRHGRSVSSTLREMFSKAAGGQGVVDALTNEAATTRPGDDEATAPETKPGARRWWGWGKPVA